VKMVSMEAVHSVAVEMHVGMLTLAAICILIKIADALYERFLGERGEKLRSLLRKASFYAGPASFLAAIGGIVGIVASAITGYLIMPGESLINSALGMNKVMVTILALEFWLIFVVIGARQGQEMWARKQMAILSTVNGLLGYLFTIIGGSLGGTMAGKGSIMDPIWELFRVDLHSSWVIGTEMGYILILAVNVLAVLTVAISQRLARSKVAAEGSTDK